MIRSFFSLYSPRYVHALVCLLHQHDDNVGRYLVRYWRTNNFFDVPGIAKAFRGKSRILETLLWSGIAIQLATGLTLIAAGIWHDFTGGWQFGLALILAYPLVWAHLLAVLISIWWLLHPKALGRAILCGLLEGQVRRLRKRHPFKVVAVVGSIGKTSTKMAIASILQASKRVLWQEGNYNDRVTVPLIFFEHKEPAIFNVAAWLRIVIKNRRTIRQTYPYDVVVIELGPDAPGQMKRFAYTNPDLVVVTAITAEHMAQFITMDAVAAEELTSLGFSKRALINVDDTPAHYIAAHSFASYGLDKTADYHITERARSSLAGQEVTFRLQKDSFTMVIPLLGQQGAKIALAAAATAHMLGFTLEEIKKGMSAVSAFAGRLQILPGILKSTLIDDSYNSSPVATKAALDILQSGEAPQRIAILGSMNELGAYSPEAHREVAEHCDPQKLDWVVTVGKDAQQYLAPIAEQRGCRVKSFISPYEAGDFVKEQLQEGAVVLAKGSQHLVYVEEALKPLLANKSDAAKLVRQSATWRATKAKYFK